MYMSASTCLIWHLGSPRQLPSSEDATDQIPMLPDQQLKFLCCLDKTALPKYGVDRGCDNDLAVMTDGRV